MIKLNSEYVRTKLSNHKINSLGYVYKSKNPFEDNTIFVCRSYGHLPYINYGIIFCKCILVPEEYTGKKFRIKLELVDDDN